MEPSLPETLPFMYNRPPPVGQLSQSRFHEQMAIDASCGNSTVGHTNETQSRCYRNAHAGSMREDMVHLERYAGWRQSRTGMARFRVDVSLTR